MKVLEMFAGSRSVGRAAEKIGFRVFSSDKKAYEGIDYPTDILEFDFAKVPFKPDIIWFSPPCTAFSTAAAWRHWNFYKNGKRIPKSATARECIRLARKCLEIVRHYQPKYWFIENPRGLLRNMPFMQGLQRHTVTYCQYGDTRMKPTDIWTNSKQWKPRPMCKPGASCHAAALELGSCCRLSGSFNRSKIPEQLCLEILRSCCN